MYAVIATGGKQERVEIGSRINVELLGEDEGAEVTFTPVLIVDGETVSAGTTALDGASVTARVLGESKGPKITGFTYKPKSRSRRRFGHRQHYTTVEITGIAAAATSSRRGTRAAAAKN
jgi:large subunit ribosomal protein L21